MGLCLSPRFMFFTVVGSIGFVVDAGVLSFLVHVGDAGPYAARMVSFPLAVTTTWYMNRRLTFRDTATLPAKSEYSRYFGVQTAGVLVNLLVYALFIEAIPVSAKIPIIPLAIGSLVALVFNYTGAKLLVYK